MILFSSVSPALTLKSIRSFNICGVALRLFLRYLFESSRGGREAEFFKFDYGDTMDCQARFSAEQKASAIKSCCGMEVTSFSL